MELAEAKTRAAQHFAAGKVWEALRLFDAALEAAPLDFECRIGVADCLAALGYSGEAAAALRETGFYALRSGHPLAAVVCARVLESLGGDADDILAALVTYYGSESELLERRAGRVSLPPADTPVTAPPTGAADDGAAASKAASRAIHCTADYAAYPDALHPIPLFSELSEAAFRRVLSTLVVHRLPTGSVVIREGEPGTSFYFVATGAVRVTSGQGEGRRDLAELSDGAVFGEMALISAQPRSASVTVVRSADILEITRESLSALAGELEAVASALHRFTKDRLLGNLLATSPLFRPFSETQKRELLRRFTSHDVGAGSDVIRQGEPSAGIFVLLSGGCDVIVAGETGTQTVSRLGAGDICGEMALLRGGGATATVRTTQPTTLLFLAREYVERVVSGVPEIRAYLEALADDRALDTRLATAGMATGGDSPVLV